MRQPLEGPLWGMLQVNERTSIKDGRNKSQKAKSRGEVEQKSGTQQSAQIFGTQMWRVFALYCRPQARRPKLPQHWNRNRARIPKKNLDRTECYDINTKRVQTIASKFSTQH